jgi:hypothetical protein
MMMKKILFGTTMILGFFVTNAQHHEMKPHAEFGLKGGLNIAGVHIENGANPDARPSFYLGGLAHIHLTKYFALQPEIMYSGQGFKQTAAGIDYKYRLNYINIPVLAQLMAGDGFRIETGPQLGILAAAHLKSGNTSTDIKDSYKSVDVAWVIGLGYIFHSGFGIDARYNLGLSNINDVSATKVNNRVFAAGIFYQFNK